MEGEIESQKQNNCQWVNHLTLWSIWSCKQHLNSMELSITGTWNHLYQYSTKLTMISNMFGVCWRDVDVVIVVSSFVFLSSRSLGTINFPLDACINCKIFTSSTCHTVSCTHFHVLFPRRISLFFNHKIKKIDRRHWKTGTHFVSCFNSFYVRKLDPILSCYAFTHFGWN